IFNDKIILLDLNYTLVSNSKTCGGRYPGRIYNQTYEEELIDLIKDNFVILITARPEKFKTETLDHIKEETGFVPDDSYWNRGMTPPEIKQYWLTNAVFPKYGDNPDKYFALESNPATRRMYGKNQIKACPKQDVMKKYNYGVNNE
ncbi:hypothetical protein LJC03_06210, partial [Methanobrevibacter sp. OttesenSCG-928-I08]|nr:hypothetical protein [Methanobrevibacter sp. OttesenSCG-928-I08]